MAVELTAANSSSTKLSILKVSFNTTFTVDNSFLPSALAFVILLDSFPIVGAIPNATSSLTTVEVAHGELIQLMIPRRRS
ncbi:hypothetical protein E2562_034263 [Oryza meyeriana var. granulata]|uniref:Uncharacterized protein n=1 Tax=Oryza meyeriana var. granulata TaxID=110450 RepID=A0A6G1ESF1_9ORYZ|nr:hypothetical protein E2562_034263 [Oryza meyeriana var. granulata]